MAKKKRKKKAAGTTNRQGMITQKKNQNRQSDIKYQKLRTKTKSMLNEWGLSTEKMRFIEPPDGVKMSEVILKLADPLLKEYGDDDKSIETIISLTITVWDKMMFPEDEQEKLQDEMIDYMVPRSGDAEDISMIVYVNDLITKRKNKYFPNLKKIIVSYDLTVSRGNIMLNIVSAPIQPKIKSNQV